MKRLKLSAFKQQQFYPNIYVGKKSVLYACPPTLGRQGRVHGPRHSSQRHLAGKTVSGLRILKQGKIHHNTLIKKLSIDNLSALYRADYLPIGENRLNGFPNLKKHFLFRCKVPDSLTDFYIDDLKIQSPPW